MTIQTVRVKQYAKLCNLHDSRTNTTTPILSLRRTPLQSTIPCGSQSYRLTISISSLAILSATTRNTFGSRDESSTVYIPVLQKVLGLSALRADEQTTTQFNRHILAIRDCSRRSSSILQATVLWSDNPAYATRPRI
jgi:hypothetical protein